MPTTDISHGATFDLFTLARELRSEPAYEAEAHTARTLVRTSDMRMVLVAMKAGGHIAEHRANETASVHALFGRIRLTLPTGPVELPAGQVLVMEKGLQHDVTAVEESAFLLTIGWRSESKR